jgi:hypothetical protein
MHTKGDLIEGRHTPDCEIDLLFRFVRTLLPDPLEDVTQHARDEPALGVMYGFDGVYGFRLRALK